MQPTCRRQACTMPVKMLFSASVMACVCTWPISVLRSAVSVAKAQSWPDAPRTTRLSAVESTMLSLILISTGSSSASSRSTWMAPMMLCSRVRHRGALISSMLGSVGRFGSQLQSRPQPGTRVECRMATPETPPETCRPRPVTTTPSSTNQLGPSPRTLRLSG